MTNKKEVLVKRVLAAVFNVPSEEINYESSPDNIESWDSLKHMNMVIALEEEFDIEIANEDLIEMINYKLVVLILSKYII
jgi:acyl carrier protein